MHDEFAIVEKPILIPEKVMDLDLEAEFEKLFRRCDELEKRLEAEKDKTQNTQRKFLLGLLKVADALDRILQQPLNSANVERMAQRQRRNIETTRRLLAQQLKKEGVIKIELMGQLLDRTIADIEEYEEDPDLPDETVISEIVSAYRWGDGILRRAKVIVSSDE